MISIEVVSVLLVLNILPILFSRSPGCPEVDFVSMFDVVLNITVLHTQWRFYMHNNPLSHRN